MSHLVSFSPRKVLWTCNESPGSLSAPSLLRFVMQQMLGGCAVVTTQGSLLVARYSRRRGAGGASQGADEPQVCPCVAGPPCWGLLCHAGPQCRIIVQS